MPTEPSFAQLVTQAVFGADRPLTLAEIKARVEMIRPVDTRNPQATLRTAVNSNRLIASLGGRPARYTWWPRHLAGSSFRQPLADSDLETGALVLNEETWAALWPDFHGGADRSQGDVTLVLPGGRVLEARIEHLVEGQAVWGLPPTPALADWYREQRAKPEDELIVRVLDLEARRYALEFCRRSDRDEEAMAARNEALADAVEAVVRAGQSPMPYFDLIPRLIAQDAYRDPFPPDPWEDVLRADLRFVVWRFNVYLADRMVDYQERERDVPHDPWSSPRPRGDRRKVKSDEARRAWGQYLFERGMEYRWEGWDVDAESYYREALRIDPGHADAWVHLGNLCFEEGRLVKALEHYERAQAAAEARTIGDPACYSPPFWLDLDSRPFMRALYGRG
ncbi:MAG: tetratricopeptide repeat protein, partial [Anaerolineae bacterium]|nr:tetratricopeptide repeat protein [Anaerolineae bacterium]